MAQEKSNPYKEIFDQLLDILRKLPWIDILADLWVVGQKLMQGFAVEGMYEVLEYESTLELLDDKGRKAIFRKRQKVRYLQDNIIAYQDQAWGDGKILLNYRCSPGKAVDRYRPGHKTYVLISLRKVKNRGDIDEFNIEWEMKNSFLRDQELWETEISHVTKDLRVEVIFPKRRPPLKAALVEGSRQRYHVLNENAQNKLPDGRWSIHWEIDQPRLHERYILQWEW